MKTETRSLADFLGKLGSDFVRLGKFVLVAIIVTVLLIIISASTATAQRSRAYSGDKSSRVITKSQGTFESMINDLKKEKSALEKSRKKMSKKPAYYEKLLGETDTLIRVYQQKIMLLEDQMITSITTAAGKEREDRVELKSHDVTALAEAYFNIKYADNLLAGNGSANGDTGKKLVGMVENTTYDNPVIVRVSGPGNSTIFTREFTLGSRQKSPEFELPMIGKYTASFISPKGRACVTKPIGPNTVYYDGAKQLDFKASFIY